MECLYIPTAVQVRYGSPPKVLSTRENKYIPREKCIENEDGDLPRWILLYSAIT